MKQIIVTIGTILLASQLYGQGGVGINNNGSAPNTSAMLDVASTNKGLLIPRVSLTSTTDATTITNGNVTSLLVYNTATIADVVPGYYYWDGTVWKTIGGNDADANPTNEIQDLQLIGNNLTITNNGTPTTIDLSTYLDNTDAQTLSLTGSILSISNGNNVTLTDNINDADSNPTNEIQDLQLVGNNLTITNNGTPTTIDLSAYLDNTDDQNIDSVILNGNNLTVYIEDGTSSSVDLSSLSDHDWYEVGGTTAPDNITDDIYTQGNVGIGVTLPIEKLHVRGQTILVENNGGSVFNSTTFGATNTIGPHFIGASSRGVIGTPSHLQTNDILSAFQGRDFMVPGTYSGMHIRASENHTNTTLGTSIDFTTIPNGTTVSQQRMIILNNGNVGIGTTTPTNKLDINGDLRIQTITPGSGADVALVADATGVVKQVAPNPVGEIIIFPVTTPPTGYLICDGSAISRTTYSGLFAVLGTSYGPGDGSTTFNLPDLRGEFVRGSDNGRGADTGRVIGSWQTGTKVTNDNGTYPAVHTIANINQNSVDPTDINMLIYYANAPGSVTAGNTYVGMVRPRNVAMNYCIRF